MNAFFPKISNACKKLEVSRKYFEFVKCALKMFGSEFKMPTIHEVFRNSQKS